MNVLVLIIAVAIGSVVIYAIERYTRKKVFDVFDAAKIGIVSGAGAGGILYATGGTPEVITNAISSTAQDMFVGKPAF